MPPPQKASTVLAEREGRLTTLAPPGRVIFYRGRFLPDTGPSREGWHKLSMFALCPFLYNLEHNLGVKAPPKDYHVRGSLLHAGIGAHYLQRWALLNGQNPDMFWGPIDAIALTAILLEPELAARGCKFTAADFIEAVTLAVDAHNRHYALDGWKPFQVEAELQVWITLPNGKRKLHTRGLDLAIETSAGLIKYVDHKSRARRNSKTENSYAEDETFVFMWKHGVAHYGDRFGGVVFNYIEVPEKAPWPSEIDVSRDEPPRLPLKEKFLPTTLRHYMGGIDALEGQPEDAWPRAQVGSGICQGLFSPCHHRRRCGIEGGGNP